MSSAAPPGADADIRSKGARLAKWGPALVVRVPEDGPAHDEAVPAERWMAFLDQASFPRAREE